MTIKNNDQMKSTAETIENKTPAPKEKLIQKLKTFQNGVIIASGFFYLPFALSFVLAGQFWIFDLIINFIPQGFVIGIIIIILISGFSLTIKVLENKQDNDKEKRSIWIKIFEWVSLFVISSSGFLVLQYYYQPNINNVDKSSIAKDAQIKIGFYNYLYTNQEYGAVNQMLEKLDLDVIGFTEFDQEKAGKLSVLAKYPFKSFDGEQNIGKQIAIYSKYQIENEIKRDEANELIKTETNNILGSIISAKVNKGGSSYRVVFLHTPAPINNLLWERRNSFNKALPFFLENFEKEQVVVMGDFNTSPWSPHFVKLEDKTGLNYFNPLKGKGSLFTWSKDGGKTEFYKPLSVHIDHIFISKNLYLVDSGVDEKAGSDHNLVWVEVK